MQGPGVFMLRDLALGMTPHVHIWGQQTFLYHLAVVKPHSLSFLGHPKWPVPSNSKRGIPRINSSQPGSSSVLQRTLGNGDILAVTTGGGVPLASSG